MARTRATARKSTGGKAPRIALATPAVRRVPSTASPEYAPSFQYAPTSPPSYTSVSPPVGSSDEEESTSPKSSPKPVRRKVAKFIDVTDRGILACSSENSGQPLRNLLSSDLNAVYGTGGGMKPHWVDISFSKPRLVSYVRVVANMSTDSSYYPNEAHVLTKKTAKSEFVEVLPMQIVAYEGHPEEDTSSSFGNVRELWSTQHNLYLTLLFTEFPIQDISSGSKEAQAGQSTRHSLPIQSHRQSGPHSPPSSFCASTSKSAGTPASSTRIRHRARRASLYQRESRPCLGPIFTTHRDMAGCKHAVLLHADIASDAGLGFQAADRPGPCRCAAVGAKPDFRPGAAHHWPPVVHPGCIVRIAATRDRNTAVPGWCPPRRASARYRCGREDIHASHHIGCR